jgi:CTP:molybdopterin cytidylyltransferase MocA
VRSAVPENGHDRAPDRNARENEDLFDRSCFQELLALDDETGAKAIILSNRERVAELLFPEGKIDIDTAADYEKLTAQS